MRTSPMLLLGLMVLACQGAGPDRSPQKLRSLAMTPLLSLSLSISYDSVRKPETLLGAEELARRIEVLRSQLKESPNDGSRWLQLGRCLDAAQEKDDAHDAYLKAADVFRVRAEASSRDARLQAQFAEALRQAAQEAEAGRVLRSTLEVAPDEWVCWVALGEWLDHQALVALYGGTNRPAAGESLIARLKAELERRPTADQVEDARRFRAEAEQCFDRAVSLAPEEPGVFVARALHRSSTEAARLMIAAYRGLRTMDARDFQGALGADDVCADWALAARLSRTNEAVIACWGWSEAIPGIMGGGHATRPLDNLTSARRSRVLEAMRMLESLAESPNPETAAGAWETLGVLRLFVIQEPSVAEEAFRRAVNLNPSRRPAWGGILATGLLREDHQSLVAMFDERLKHDDTVLNRIGAAKMCDLAGKAGKAITHARAAVRLDPEDAMAHLCLGAMLLRHGDEEGFMAETRKHLMQAMPLLQEVEDADERAKLRAVCALNAAIVLALDGRTDMALETLRRLDVSRVDDEKFKARLKEVMAFLDD